MESPQQILACLRMLLVDPLSAIFKKQQTIQGSGPFPLQCFVEHQNSWLWRPLMILMVGLASKHPYTGEVQVFARRSREITYVKSLSNFLNSFANALSSSSESSGFSMISTSESLLVLQPLVDLLERWSLFF